MIHRFLTFHSSLFTLLSVGLLALLLLSSCSSKTDADRAQDVVVETLTAFYAGDVDSYISHSDFGSELTSGRDSLLRLMLGRYVGEVGRKGGLQAVEPLKATLENDSVAVVSYALRFGNGSRETCIKRLKKVGDEWKMCVSE